MTGKLQILATSGHDTVEWDDTITVKENSRVTLPEVKQHFDTLIAKNYLAFAMDTPTDGRQIRSFDERGTAPEVIMSPQLRGG